MSRPPPTRLSILHYLRALRVEHGGIVRSVLDLCSTMAARGHDVALVTLDPTDVPKSWFTPSAAGEVVNTPRVIVADRTMGFGTQIVRSIRAADVVHLHGPWDVYNLAIARFARALGKPYVLTAHGMLDDWSMSQKELKKKLYHALFAKKLLDEAAVVHCTAQAELEQVQRWLGRSNGAVLHTIVDFSFFDKLPGPDRASRLFPFLYGHKLRLLFLSRLHYKKGIEALIDAACELKDHGLDFQLVIAGPGSPRYVRALERRVARLGLGEHAHLVGHVTGEDKLALYEACDLFVLPTSQENFGLVLVEAMACGTAVVTTRGTDIWREIQGGGAVICEAQAATLARTIRELAADSTALASRGRAARTWVLQFFDVNRLLDGYEALYAQAISEQRAVCP